MRACMCKLRQVCTCVCTEVRVHILVFMCLIPVCARLHVCLYVHPHVSASPAFSGRHPCNICPLHICNIHIYCIYMCPHPHLPYPALHAHRIHILTCHTQLSMPSASAPAKICPAPPPKFAACRIPLRQQHCVCGQPRQHVHHARLDHFVPYGPHKADYIPARWMRAPGKGCSQSACVRHRAAICPRACV